MGLFYGGGFNSWITVHWYCMCRSMDSSNHHNHIPCDQSNHWSSCSEEEEIIGLDAEHGLASAYAGFSIMDVSNTMMMDVNENTDLGEMITKAASDK